MSRQLLLSCNSKLQDMSKPDVSLWYEIYRLININVSLVDRCNIIDNPYNFKNIFPIPKDLTGFNKTYNEICIERATELITRSRRNNKPIIILWSGGIDSTVVLVSFIIASGGDFTNIKIALNADSIRENPKFYYQYVRGKFELISSEQTLDLLDGKSLMVGGEFNDQLFGTDLYNAIRNYSSMDMLFEPYTDRNIIPFFIHSGMKVESANLWYTLLDEQIKKSNVCEIKTVKDFFWWYNFSFKWQSVYFRIVARSTHQELINKNFLDEHYHQFFVTADFQKWSMLNPDKKIGKTWPSYKKTAKEMIFEFNKDQDYFDNKLKFGSLSGVFRQRNVPDALALEDDRYIPIWNIDKSEFYLENNFFNQYIKENNLNKSL